MGPATVIRKSTELPQAYGGFLRTLKAKIAAAQLRAATAVNRELITLYWEIGSALLQKQQHEGWGSKTVERLAGDLRTSFPDLKGFSTRNVRFMVQFAKEFANFQIVKRLVSQIPWGHNILIMQKLSSLEERTWYAQQVLTNGWSRSVLDARISSNLFARQGSAVTNFADTLPDRQSQLADQLLKDPYCFDFLTLTESHDERQLESGLLDHLQKFLLELGAGFAFVGRQVHLEVADQDFYLDLLFYHYKLRCFIVIELKAADFRPEFIGKMNFYLSAVDDIIRQPEDRPTIGLLLCKGKNRLVAEYALRGISKPIGISQYETAILKSLPDELKGSLPSIEEIERELAYDPCTG
ncbi:MAG: YhcG family protein [Parachlamydiales bacterium]